MFTILISLRSSNDSIVFGLQNGIFHTMPFIYISMTTYEAYHKSQLSDKKMLSADPASSSGVSQSIFTPLFPHIHMYSHRDA